jgi:peptidoglycan/LPS O-acetylase OafA/YrhL
MTPDASTPSRSLAIDLVKGIAIVSVVCLHTLSEGTLEELGARFHIWQAVTVFLFLLGLNAASSMRRRGGRTLRELYSSDYLAGRFDRVYVPFLIAFAVTLALAILTHTPHSSGVRLVGDLIVGLFPIDGPGNYFVTLLFEFVLAFPLIFWGLRRWPRGTLLLCLALNGAFEVLAPRVAFFKANPYAYVSCLLGLLFLVALGGFLAAIPAKRALRSPWLWGGTLVSVVYLALLEADPSLLLAADGSLPGLTLLSACYPAFLVLLGIAFLPAVTERPVARFGALLGRASYHIFLVQIGWFGLAVWSTDSLPALLGNLAVTLSVGLAFYGLMARTPLPTAAGLLVRRRASPAEARGLSR